MAEQVLPLRPHSSAVIPRRSRLLRPASPFKLRYLAFSSSPPPLLSLAAGSREVRRPDPRVRSAAGQAKSLVQEEPELGDRIPGPWTRTRTSTRDGRADGSAADRRKARGPAVALDRSPMLKRRPAVETLEDENEDGAGDAIKTSAATPGADESYLSLTRFDQCPISALSLRGIQDAGYERMTVVQEATLPVILEGKDVLAKAKTGTGKTVAFLLPSIESVSKFSPVDRNQKKPPINVLVMCPTRELASQAAAEANKLLKYHPYLGVQVVIGGTRLTQEQKRMQANPCQFLVATPGRLIDHIENTPGFVTRLMGVKVLILDEADRLLDMGFRKAIEKIVAVVPKQRQTLLFSATVSDEVKQICHIAMKRDHQFINTVEVGSEETHAQVRQMHLIASLDKHFPILYNVLMEHISEDADYKVIVFCTTAMVTKLVANLLSELHLNVREIHSRKSQSHRTKVSEEFRTSKGLILVGLPANREQYIHRLDRTGRKGKEGKGLLILAPWEKHFLNNIKDLPVKESLPVPIEPKIINQVGLPANREQYIHRLGRTGRKGKEGKGLLILAPWEKHFLNSIKDLPVKESPPVPVEPKIINQVKQALSNVEMKSKESAYQAWLGYYNSDKIVGRDKSNLVSLANEFSRSMGLDSPPAIPKNILRKMGLNNVPGLRAA